MNEVDTIKQISYILGNSPLKLNEPFESDSEILNFLGKKLLLNVDEFSEEDMFREHNPYILGRNVAIAALSDIFASGGIPIFYSHSLVVKKSWTEDYIARFSTGVSEILEECNVGFAGGDFGCSELWRCTGVVIGTYDKKTMLRSNAKENQLIYVSGKIGSGNLEAFLKLNNVSVLKNFNTKFKLRQEESKLISKYSDCCTDSSDGLFNAVNNISKASETGFVLKNIPYIKASSFSKMFSLPKSLLFLSECGEYELVFTINPEDEKDFLNDAKIKELKFYKIGTVTKPYTKLLYEEKEVFNFINFDISARDFNNKKNYLKKLIDFLKGDALG